MAGFSPGAQQSAPQAPSPAPRTDLGKLAEQFWNARKMIEDLTWERKSANRVMDDRWQDIARDDIAKAEKFCREVESVARSNGYWDRILSLKPTQAATPPLSASTGPATVSMRDVTRSAYGTPSWSERSFRSPYSGDTSYSGSTTTTAPVSAKVTRDETRPFVRELLVNPSHTQAISHEMTMMANLDRGNYRDCAQEPGWRRTFTKVILGGLAIGMEAVTTHFTRRILGGDTPFEIFPGANDED